MNRVYNNICPVKYPLSIIDILKETEIIRKGFTNNNIKIVG